MIGNRNEKTMNSAKLGCGRRLRSPSAVPPKIRVARPSTGRRVSATSAARMAAEATTKKAPRYKKILMLVSLRMACKKVRCGAEEAGVTGGVGDDSLVSIGAGAVWGMGEAVTGAGLTGSGLGGGTVWETGAGLGVSAGSKSKP